MASNPNAGGATTSQNNQPPVAAANGSSNPNAPQGTIPPITSINLQSGDGADGRVEHLTDELKRAIYEDRGEKSIQAVRATIDRGEIENISIGVAVDNMENFKTAKERKAYRELEAKAQAKNMSVEDYTKSQEYAAENKFSKRLARGVLNAVKKAPMAAVVATVATAAFVPFGVWGAGAVGAVALFKNTAKTAREKQKALREYRDVAKEAIEETGNLDAGQAAVEKLRENTDKIDRLKDQLPSVFNLFHRGKRKEINAQIEAAKKERSDIVKNLKNDFKAGQGSEQYIMERAKEAFNDESVEKQYTENGDVFRRDVKDGENNKTSTLKSGLEQYAKDYLNATSDEDRKKAEEKFYSVYTAYEPGPAKIRKDKAIEIVGNRDDLLAEVRAAAEKAKETLESDAYKDYSAEEKDAALGRAIRESVNVNLAQMKAGINTTEVLTVSQKASLRSSAVVGAVLGTLAGIMAEGAKAVTRTAISKGLENKQHNAASIEEVKRINKIRTPVMTAVAAVIGGLVAMHKKKNELRRENVKSALGGEKEDFENKQQRAKEIDEKIKTLETSLKDANDRAQEKALKAELKKLTKERKELTAKTSFEMVSAEKTARELEEIRAVFEDPGVTLEPDTAKEYREWAIGLMAKFDAANKLQNQYGHKFKLISFEGRKNVEKAKLDYIKNKVALKKLLKEKYGLDDTDSMLESATKALVEGEMGKDVAEKKSNRTKAIALAFGKGAAVAAVTAISARGVMALVGKTGIMDRGVQALERAERWRFDVMKKLGFKEDGRMMAWVAKTNIIAKNNPFAQKAPGETEPENPGSEKGERPGNTEIEETHENEMNAETVREKNAAMLVEDDPEGGVSVGFDMDGDGQLDSGEYLVGEGEAAGINFNNPEEYEAFKNRMESEFRMTVEKGQYDTDTFANIKVKDFVGQQNNVVNIDVNNLSEKSKTMVVIHRPTTTTTIDGMNYFEVKIDGNIPEGASAYIDLDGDGPMQALKFDIHNGKALVPAGAVDTDSYMANGKANFLGKFIVGREDVDGSFISYGADSGKVLSGDTVVKATERVRGSLITVIDQDDGNAWSQFAIRGDGAKETAENLSHLFNGIERGRIPKGFVVPDSDNGRGPVRLANGAEIEDLDYKGGYRPEYDSGLNDIHKTGGNHSLVGIPFEADVNGDGVLDQAESARFVRQWLVATGTDANVLAQNAANFGMLEPDVLRDTLFNGDDELMMNTLRAWGINDGVINNLSELDAFMDQLKLPANADLYDRLVNSTITEMQDQMQGCTLSLETITNRNSTYSLKGDLAISSNGTRRQAIYFFRESEGGSREYIGNKGFLAKELGAGENGRVGVMTNCRQSEVEKKVTSEKTKTTSEKTSEKTKTDPENTKTSPEKTKTDPENTKTSPEKTKTDPENTKTSPEKTKTDPENTKTDPEKTKTDPENTKTDPEKTKTDPENTKTDPENNITPKTGDMNAGPNVTQLDETPAPKADTVYVEATPDNHVTAEVKPGAPVHDADASVYANDTVLDEVTGEPLKDSAGNIYITKPEELINEATPSGVSGEALKEEIAQNIADDTQTTYTPDTTKWQSGATETVLPDLNVVADNTSSATEGVVDDVVDNTASSVTSNAASNIVEEAAEEIPIIGGGGNTNYDEDELAELLGLKPAA